MVVSKIDGSSGSLRQGMLEFSLLSGMWWRHNQWFISFSQSESRNQTKHSLVDYLVQSIVLFRLEQGMNRIPELDSNLD